MGAILASRRRREGGSSGSSSLEEEAYRPVLAFDHHTAARDVGLIDGLRRRRESALLARERRAAAECTRQYHADVLALICFVSRAQVLSVRGKKVLEMLVRKPSARFLRLAGNEPLIAPSTKQKRWSQPDSRGAV